MTRRAAIYIRTSPETQSEKPSPVEQEVDCRHFAQEKGSKIVRVYRDVEKYRVGNKLVEPSGSLSDHPGLLARLNDATKDEFDVTLVWREDRLYRGLRSMLTVLETVQDYKIEIMLAKENFDPKITPVRTWAAPNGIGWNEGTDGDGRKSSTESRESEHRARPLWLPSYR
jgi:DNA invertase Pin-like site-specific DNA recombinase